MGDVTGAEVWEALASDPRFSQRYPEVIREVLRRYIEALPEMLVEELVPLDSVVTFESFARAKYLFFANLVKSDFPGEVERMLGQPAAVTIVAFENFAIALLTILAVIARGESASLFGGKSEEETMLAVGMSPENVAKFLAKELTIADLLRSEPGLFVLDDSRRR